MLTASYVCYWNYLMKPDYVSAAQDEVSHVATIPLDFGALDAPFAMAAGSFLNQDAMTMPGLSFPLPSTTSRRHNQ